MNALIEKLKTNKEALCFLSVKEKEVLYAEKKRGNVETLCQCGCCGAQPTWLRADEGLEPHEVYRIKPDYQPEPEYDNLPVEIHEDALGVWDIDREIGVRTFTYLQCLPSLPGFRGYFDGEEVFYETGLVAIKKEKEGKKVIARFER